MSTLTAALTATLARRDADAAIAAAREEQREACALIVADAWTKGWVAGPALIRATPLDATPLADELAALRADLATAAEVTARLTEERDTIKASVAAVEDANYALRAEVERLKADIQRLCGLNAAKLMEWSSVCAERDAALALADATQAELNAERERHHATASELNKAVTWLDRCAWARATIDLDAGPLEVQLAEAAGRVERLTTHRATLHRVLSALLLVADDHFDCHQSAEARVALEDCQP